MDSRLNYQEVIKHIVSAHAKGYAECSTGQIQTIFDDERKHYLLLDLEWRDDEYIHHAPIHLDVIDDKIWIQYDDTEEGIATDLLDAGVPAQDIVLGFRHPHDRKHTGFADVAAPGICHSAPHTKPERHPLAARTDSVSPFRKPQPSLRTSST